MTLGIIGRCDAGGLGTLTSEVFRHLKPERTLLLHMGTAGRGGDGNPSLYDVEGATQVVYPADWQGKLSDRHVDWLCAEGIDTLWSAETFYDDAVIRRAHQNGIKTVCYVMPELNPWNRVAPGNTPARPRELVTPTGWEIGRSDDSMRVLPFPIARDRLPFRQRGQQDGPLHLYHVVGAAMLDRNGTELLLTALNFVREPVRVTVRTEKGARSVSYGNGVTLEWESGPTLNYWMSYPADADVLVMPRRYGGLCLPIQEAASLGMPAVILDSDPYADAPFTVEIESKPGRLTRMKGGEFMVHDADPHALAERIDYLASHRHQVRLLSIAANRWASERSWFGDLGLAWRTMLR